MARCARARRDSAAPGVKEIHNGADDNASGTAMVIELAGKLAAMKNQLKRSIIFISFSGEEMGLLGSKYFTDHSPVDMKKIKAELVPDSEILEFVCAENEKDLPHMVGRPSDSKPPAVMMPMRLIFFISSG